MNLRSVRDIKKLKNKRVLLRLDLDVPFGDNNKIDYSRDWRLIKSLPTIKFLIKKGAKVIIVGHMGRPKGQIVNNLKLKPVVEHLAKLFNVKTGISNEKIGPFQTYMFLAGKNEVMILENVRFFPGEELNSKHLARELAGLAEIYVNDAFAVSHRNHVSISAITKYLPSYAGFNLEKEIKILSKILKRPGRPLALIVGGVKAKTKLQVVEKFIPRADYILIGSAIANNFYKALDFEVGESRIEPGIENLVKRIIKKPQYRILSPLLSFGEKLLPAGVSRQQVEKSHNLKYDDKLNNILLDPREIKILDNKLLKKLQKRVILPVDVVMTEANKVWAKKKNIEKMTRLIDPQEKKLSPKSYAMLDIGKQTIELYKKIIKRSKTIIWSGPMGMFENPPFNKGTNEIAKVITRSRGKAIIGGGDTVAALCAALTPFNEVVDEIKIKKYKQNIFISSGGGAMLEFLLNPELPGIKPLIKS